MKKYDPLKHIWRGLFIFFILIMFFWGSYALQDKFFALVGTVGEHIRDFPVLYIILFVVLGALSSILSPFSSVPLVPFVVSTWGKLTTTALLITGWLIGSIITYSIGRYIGRPFIKKYYSLKKLDHYEKLLPKKTEFGLLVLFRMALPIEVPGYLLGIAKIKFWKYLLITFLAELPIGVFVVYGSDALVERKFEIVLLWSSAAAILLLITGYLFYRTVNSRK
ncbi:hypothetical protein GF366_00160 [Candidatus Peregrinibacteria bacterium]|nr:hypothetical protein [Candidatus Peregrinibacteria bacterium]